MSENIIPWEQQPGEPDQQYEVLRSYLDYGRKRSYKKMSLIHFCSLNTIKNWAKKWNWSKRLSQYEQYLKESCHSKAFEKIRLREKEKYEFKMNQSELSLRFAKFMLHYYENYDKAAKSDVLKKEMKFLREMLKTINMLLKNAEFPLNELLIRSSLDNDIRIEQFVKNDSNDASAPKLNENNNINLIFNSLTGYLNSKIENNGTIGTTASDESDNSIIQEELQNP